MNRMESSVGGRLPMLCDSFRISGFEKATKSNVLNLIRKDLPVDPFQILIEVDT